MIYIMLFNNLTFCNIDEALVYFLHVLHVIFFLFFNSIISFRRDTVGVFECPTCLSPLAHLLPRYQAEIIARYEDVVDLNDNLFASATGTGLKTRQTALLDRIKDAASAPLPESLAGKTCRRILESMAKALDANATRLNSPEIGLLEAKVAILTILRGLGSKDDDSWSVLCERIAAYGAVSSPMVAQIGSQLRTRGEEAAAERLAAAVTLLSYERGLWKRCTECRIFYQGPRCRDC